ncbi:MAG TPA: GNAT family N-acetyltransferase [Mucilaginibacter sp.]|nr:GNAT family N-acetyltransferase [Mucilaginibacter sp.]
MPAPVRANKINNPDDLQRAFAIRYEVFVSEQNCPPEIEVEFNDSSTHFIAYIGEEPVGAARYRKTDKGYKLERFAVRAVFRGRGVAQELIKAVISDLPPDAHYIYLHAQSHAAGLYEKAGFKKEGDEFEEAGMKHFKMVLKHW